LKAAKPGLPVIVMSAHTDVASTAGAFRGGAHEFLSKPFDLDEAVALVRRALPQRESRGAQAADAIVEADASALVGDAPAMRALFRAIGRLAQAPLSVLITGETGTGKELVARALHRESPRASRPFVALNTAAIPAELLESELFGHEAGAFTGATAQRKGRFELAHGGTLFLDEVGELSEAVQAKLLRALEQRVIERVGGTQAIPVDLRLLAATNRDLEERVAAGAVRSDLFYRLNVISLRIPPLRERAGDVSLLVESLAGALAAQLGVPPRAVSREALEALRRYNWPGNVRELRNVLERALIAATGGEIRAADLPPLLSPAEGPAPQAGAAALSLEDRERQAILEALERTGGHRERAAKLLGVSVRTLYNRLREYGIQ
ncbi:MAG TPA: sigma-54 dependent transcriptional regulator, partial [Thermoanaerobaculia bacterium]|nr:sigma-54 dependent transcriptional regulator [Thermoanaerobaculia bacterium]